MGLLDFLGGGEAAVKAGDRAPDFSLPDAGGRMIGLAEFRGKKPVVLYFYPKDDTPGCTKESCSFRDHFAAFSDVGAEVIGISSDSEASHRKFKDKYKLPFTLLADAGGKVRAQFKVPRSAGILPGRVTYVIDKQGVIRHAFSSQLDVTRHVDEAQEVLRKL